jgi:hypothetical protein
MLATRREKPNQLKQSALNRGGKFCLGLRNGLLRFAGWPTAAKAVRPPYQTKCFFVVQSCRGVEASIRAVFDVMIVTPLKWRGPPGQVHGLGFDRLPR